MAYSDSRSRGPDVVIATDSMAQAGAWREFQQDQQWIADRRAGRRERKQLATSADASAFCSRCGRAWGARHISVEAGVIWSLVALVAGIVLGAVVLAPHILATM